jgi:hypothetical protein
MDRDLRRRMFRFVVRRQRARMVRLAFAGRTANAADIEAFILGRPARLRAPLFLISQVQRSGGTLLSQLFDGHPAIAAHPQELKIGYPTERDWPPLDPALGADRNFQMAYEINNIMLMKRGYTKGDHNPDRRPFFLMPRVQYRLFCHLYETSPPTNRREILDHFFTAYFNAWLNYQGDLEEKRWISAFWPRLAHHEAAVSDFFDSYPDGRIIQVIRDPKTWYPSAKSNEKSGLADKLPQEILSAWATSANSMLRNSAAYGEKVIIVRFEDLVGDTERTMRMLARELGIAYDPILSKPTFNGKSMRANSSFAVENTGLINEPLSREGTLTHEERRLIEERCGELYQRCLLARAGRDRELRPGPGDVTGFGSAPQAVGAARA